MNLHFQSDTGRIVYRQKGLVTHTGVLSGLNDYGMDTVIHNHPLSGRATVVTFEEFANGEEVYYDDSQCLYSPYETWLRAIEYVNKGVPYDLLTSNCQHLTSNACNGKHESKGLKVAAGLLLALGIGGIALSR